MKSLALHALVAVLAAALVVGGYHLLVVAPALRIGLVDVQQVFRAVQARYVKQMEAGATPAQRARAMEDARRFAADFPAQLAALADECDCLLLDRSAFIGARAGTVDLTPRLLDKVRP